MKHYLPVLAALATSLSSPFLTSLKAGELDKKTIITISRRCRGGDIAGQYVLKLQEDQSNRNIVHIFDGDGRRLIATVLGIPAYRLHPTGETEFKFYDEPTGQPSALHTWFYPGDGSGLEFRQPKKRAVPVSVEAGG